MSKSVKNVEVAKVEVVKVSREMYDSALANFDVQGKKFNLAPEVVEAMKNDYKETHAVKGTKLDSHLVRLSNADDIYKKFISFTIDELAEFNNLLIVNGMTLSRKKRGETIETEGTPQLKLVCEVLDSDKLDNERERLLADKR